MEALLHAGEIDVATVEVHRLEEAAGDNRRYRLAYLRAAAVLAQAQAPAAGQQAAIVYLNEAADLAQAIGLPGERWPIEAALARLYRAAGDEDRATASAAVARAIVETLAAKLDDPLRTQFLGRVYIT